MNMFNHKLVLLRWDGLQMSVDYMLGWPSNECGLHLCWDGLQMSVDYMLGWPSNECGLHVGMAFK